MPTGSFRLQMVILTACVTAFAMVVLTVVVQLILASQTKRDIDRVLEDRADAVAGSTTSSADEGLLVPDADLDRGVVVYSSRGVAVAGQVPPDLAETYADLSTASAPRLMDAGDNRRVFVQPFSTASGTPAVVIVDEVLTPYEEAEFYALLVSLITGALATAAAAALAAWISKRALQPVAMLASTASDWSEHDLTRRFDLGPPRNELTALAGTLDTLLDKVSSTIRSEQQLTSELAHELRTPLTTIQGTADLALMGDDLAATAREDFDEISVAAHRMTGTIATLLELARNDRDVSESATSSLVEVVHEVIGSTPSSITVEVDVPDVRLGVPHALAVRCIAPVLSNAARFATSSIRVGASASTAQVKLTIDDDGVGIAGEADRIFVAGTTSGGGSGSGLGLSLARRVARACGGEVEVTRRHSPTQFTLTFPNA